MCSESLQAANRNKPRRSSEWRAWERRARALPLWSEPCPHEVVSGKSCWCREAPLVELFRRAQSEKRARRMIHPALPGKQDQGPLCEDRSRFGVDFGDHKRVKQHLVCGFRG